MKYSLTNWGYCVLKLNKSYCFGFILWSLYEHMIHLLQVSTETGIMIYYYNVSVIVPDTSIVGGSEYHVDMGSAIQLTCIIRNVHKILNWHYQSTFVCTFLLTICVAI